MFTRRTFILFSLGFATTTLTSLASSASKAFTAGSKQIAHTSFSNIRPLKQRSNLIDRWISGATSYPFTSEYGGHTRPVRAVAFSPDGKMLASGSADRFIKVWDLDTEVISNTRVRISSTVSGRADIVSLEFSPNSQLLASGSLDGIVRVWSIQGDQLTLLYDLPSHGLGSEVNLAFSPDGTVLATGGRDKTIRVWNVSSGDLIQEIQEGQEILTLAFSPDGKILASGGIEMTVHLWDWSQNELVSSLGRYSHAIYAVAFHPTNSNIIAFSPDGSSSSEESHNTVWLWNLDGEQISETFEGHKDYISSIGFSKDGEILFSASWDDTVKIWGAESNGKLLLESDKHTMRVLSLGVHPSGAIFATGSGDSVLRIWQADE